MCIHVNDYKCLFNSRPWSVLLSQIGNFLFLLVCCDLPANSQSLTCLRLLKHLKVNNLLFWFVEHEVSCFSQRWGNWRIYWVDIRDSIYFFLFPWRNWVKFFFSIFFVCIWTMTDVTKIFMTQGNLFEFSCLCEIRNIQSCSLSPSFCPVSDLWRSFDFPRGR